MQRLCAPWRKPEEIEAGLAQTATEGEPERFPLGQVGLGGGAGEGTDAADEALALGDADGSAGVEDVELVSGLHDEIVGGGLPVIFGKPHIVLEQVSADGPLPCPPTSS